MCLDSRQITTTVVRHSLYSVELQAGVKKVEVLLRALLQTKESFCQKYRVSPSLAEIFTKRGNATCSVSACLNVESVSSCKIILRLRLDAPRCLFCTRSKITLGIQFSQCWSGLVCFYRTLQLVSVETGSSANEWFLFLTEAFLTPDAFRVASCTFKVQSPSLI